MTRTSTGKTVEERTAHLREQIAEQERSGMSVQQFCKQKGTTEQSFYTGRKRKHRHDSRWWKRKRHGSTHRKRGWNWCS